MKIFWLYNKGITFSDMVIHIDTFWFPFLSSWHWCIIHIIICIITSHERDTWFLDFSELCASPVLRKAGKSIIDSQIYILIRSNRKWKIYSFIAKLNWWVAIKNVLFKNMDIWIIYMIFYIEIFSYRFDSHIYKKWRTKLLIAPENSSHISDLDDGFRAVRVAGGRVGIQ